MRNLASSKSFSLILLSSIVLFTGCQTLKETSQRLFEPAWDIEKALKRDIQKSPNDQRDYAYLTLNNGLKVVLISDPSTDKSSASMDVHVGSSDDPSSHEGLAHFLEHMLFLGTEKYSEPDEYQKFISNHGGSHNAYTAFENTNYFFDIDPDFLEGALDRFSQQFTAPLFNEEYVLREINAVHSEYTSKIKDDSRRQFSAVKASMSKNHPYNGFSVGNLDTLKDSEQNPLRAAVLEFYQTEYSSNIMNLVILGKEPVEQLARWAKEKFSDVPNRNLVTQAMEQDFFDPGVLPAKLEIQSIMDKRSLMVGFPIPSPERYEHSQPTRYISNLLGHEGEGSLLSALKKAQLADSLSAGAQFDTQSKAILMLTIGLTQKGLGEIEQIIQYIFAYTDLIASKGIQQQYFDEQAQMLDISFAYQEKAKAISLTRGLATAMYHGPINETLVRGYQLNDYNPELYKQYLNFIRPDNMLVVVTAQSIEGDERTKWYDTPYSLNSIELSEHNFEPSDQIRSKLQLPKANKFIPNNVNLLKLENDKTPRKVIDHPGIELWHSTDVSFGTPKSNLFVTLRSPEAMKSAYTQNSTELMVAMFKDALVEFAYPAYLAGLNYELYNHSRGITIKVSGYSDKQMTLLREILKYTKEVAFKQERFDIIKEQKQRSLENETKKKPFQQAMAHIQNKLINPSWTPQERLSALQKIDLTSLEAFRNSFFKKLDIAMLSNGNVDTQTSTKLASEVSEILLSKADRVDVKRVQITKLAGERTNFDTFEVDHPDTAFVLYLQGDSKSYEEQTLFMLLSQALANDYYSTMRTEKQLGYIVFAPNFNMMEVPGIAFVVQSPTTAGPVIYQETSNFLTQEQDKIKALDIETFDRYKQAVITRLSKADNTLYEKSNRYWQEIERENVEFNTREKLIEALKSINKTRFVGFYESLLSKPGKGLLIYTAKDETLSAQSLQRVSDKPSDWSVFDSKPSNAQMGEPKNKQ